MKQAEILPLALTGRFVAVGEFRDWEAKEIGSNGKSTIIQSTFCTAGREALQVDEFAPRGFKLEQCQRPAIKPGTRVCIEATAKENTKWGVRVRGKVHVIDG